MNEVNLLSRHCDPYADIKSLHGATMEPKTTSNICCHVFPQEADITVEQRGVYWSFIFPKIWINIFTKGKSQSQKQTLLTLFGF